MTLIKRDNPVSQSVRWTYFLWTIALLAAVTFPFSAKLAGFQDGDGLLTSLISTQKLTWYFWGQDRLLNVIPALAWPISDLEWNLRAQIFLRTLFAFLAPAGILCFLTDNRRTIALGTFLTNAMMMLGLSQYGVFNLYVQHNPFGTSLVLLWAAWRLAQAGGGVRTVLATLVLMIAYATNFALFAVSLPMLGLIFVLGSRPRTLIFIFGLMNVLAILAAKWHGMVFGDVHDTQFSLTVSMDAIRAGYAGVAQQVAWAWLAAASLAMLSVGVWKKVPRIWTSLGLAAGFVLLVGALSCATWAQINGYNIRYYLIFLIGFLAVASYTLLTGIERTMLSSMVNTGGSIILLVLAFFCGLGGVSSSPSALLTPQWRNQSPAIAQIAITEQTPLIVGGFWDVWSAVYEVDRMPGPHITAYGATLRGDILRDKIVHAAGADGSIHALCFLDSADACAAQASAGLKTPIQPVPGSPDKVLTAAGKTIRIMTLRFVDPATAATAAIGRWGLPLTPHPHA